MHHWIFNQNIAHEHFYSQANYEFMFIPTLKTGKLGVDLTIMDKKDKITFLGNSVHVDAK